jgi:hypothetical protein
LSASLAAWFAPCPASLTASTPARGNKPDSRLALIAWWLRACLVAARLLVGACLLVLRAYLVAARLLGCAPNGGRLAVADCA